MNTIRCLVIDDEELARKLLDNYISRLPHLELVDSFKQPIAALQCLQSEQIDLIFLDIQMPQLTGIEFLKTLKVLPQIILTTAYSEYAVESYALNVTDYLLKPFSFERFLQAVNKASEQIALKQPKSSSSTSTSTKIEEEKNYQIVKSEHKLHRVFHHDILYIQSMQEYVAYYTQNGRIIAFGSLKSLEEELPDSIFMRVHKSYIVNTQKVSTIEGNLLHIGDEKIPVGGSYRERVKTQLF